MSKRRVSKSSPSPRTRKPKEARPVEGQERFEVDLWHRRGRSRRMPASARFACTYRVSVVIDNVDESAWLVRHPDRTELWTRGHVLKDGISVVDHEPPEDDVAAAEALIDIRIRAGVGHEDPHECIEEGLVTAERFAAIREAFHAEIEEVQRKAQEVSDAPILAACRELGLPPDPSPRNPDYWTARCPGTNHGLQLRASTSEFFCGYCGRSGGVEELRRFAELRRAAR